MSIRGSGVPIDARTAILCMLWPKKSSNDNFLEDGPKEIEGLPSHLREPC
jgi:hypothetical protein